MTIMLDHNAKSVDSAKVLQNVIVIMAWQICFASHDLLLGNTESIITVPLIMEVASNLRHYGLLNAYFPYASTVSLDGGQVNYKNPCLRQWCSNCITSVRPDTE